MLNINMNKIETDGSMLVNGVTFKLTTGDVSDGSGPIKIDGSDAGTFKVTANPTAPNVSNIDAKFETNETSWPTLHVVQEASSAQFAKPWDLVIKKQGNLLKGDLILPGDRSTSTWSGNLFNKKQNESVNGDPKFTTEKRSKVLNSIRSIKDNKATPNTIVEVI